MAYQFVSYEDHIADLLVSKGYRRFVGASPLAWDITIGRMNDLPDDQITIYQVGGNKPEVRWLVDYPAIQIKVRGGANNFKAAREKAEILSNLLVGQASYTAANGDRIVSIGGIGTVGALGWDDKKRPEFVLNLSMITEPHPDNRPNSNREPL